MKKQDFVNLKSCPVCGCTEDEPYMHQDHRNIVKCLNCSHVYAKQFDSQALADSYCNDYYSSPQDPRINAWIEKNDSVWAGLVSSLVQYEIKSLCDIGAGTGGFLIKYNQRFPDVDIYAVESSKHAREALAAKLPDLQFIAENAEGISSANQTFDAITLFQTLEHVANPKKLCDNIYNQLDDNGLVFMTVPNINSYKVLMKCDTHCFPNKTHLQFFSFKNLSALLRQSGFVKIKRIVSFGGSNLSGWKNIPQYLMRKLGISAEIRIIAFKSEKV